MSEEIFTEEQEEQARQEAFEKARDEEYASVFDEDSALDHLNAAPEAKSEEKVVEEVKEEIVEEEQTPSEISPTLKAEVDDLRKALEDKETRLKQSESRIGALQNKYHQAVKLADSLKDAPTREEIEEALKSTAKWKEMMEDYPSMSLVDERLSKNEQALKSEISALKGEISGIEQKTLTVAEQRKQAKMNNDVKVLKEYYPDYFQVAQSQEFATWLGEQPPHIRIEANSNDLAAAARTMYRFKKDTEGEKAAQPEVTAQDIKQERLSMSSETPKNNNLVVTSKTDEELSLQEMRDKIFDEEFSDTR